MGLKLYNKIHKLNTELTDAKFVVKRKELICEEVYYSCQIVFDGTT